MGMIRLDAPRFYPPETNRRINMLSATDAAALYTLPPFTLEEVEEKIRNRAVSESYTCFEKGRITSEVFVKLREAGYSVEPGAHDFIVRWR